VPDVPGIDEFTYGADGVLGRYRRNQSQRPVDLEVVGAEAPPARTLALDRLRLLAVVDDQAVGSR